MKANHKNKKQIPLCGGIHPSGGFVAWPDKYFISDEEKAGYELWKRIKLRKGFVAWPEGERRMN